MNLSGYFIVFAVVAAVSVVYAQQSNTGVYGSYTISIIKNSSKVNQDANVFPDATLTLENKYINGTNLISESEYILIDGISRAEQMVLQDPEGAKELLLDAFNQAQIPFFAFGIPNVFSVGEALILSNEAARQGLEKAMKYLEIAGQRTFIIMNEAEDFFIQGIDAGGNESKALLEAVNATVRTGYAICFKNIQESILEADKALRDAQLRPIQGQGEYVSCEDPVDPESADAIEDINRAAENALQRGAKPDLVQQVNSVFNCSVVEFVNIVNNELAITEKLKIVADIEPLAAKEIFLKLAQATENKVTDIAANIYMLFGDVVLNTENGTYFEGAAILAIESGQGLLLEATKHATDLISFGLGYDDEISNITFEAIAKISTYAKIVFIRALVQTADLVFSAM